MSILLGEGRKEDLNKKYANKFSKEDLNWILNISDLQDFNHKYTDFVLKSVHPDHVVGDTEIGVNLVKSFDKYQSQLDKKDINQYKSFEELDSALTPFYEKRKQKRLEGQVKKIYEDDKFVVLKPETEEASCKYGSNTKWCVTQKGGGHFERYTSGNQGLYFIINKTNSTNKNYSKVAIHFNEDGDAKYWDSQDSPMSQREIDILNYAFPEVIESINKDYEKLRGNATDKILTRVFDTIGETSVGNSNYLNSHSDLSVYIRGFQNNDDLGFGHSEAEISILLWSMDGSKSIDLYKVFITYKSKDKKTFTASIGFEGKDEIPGDDFEDLGLEEWGIDVTYNIGRSPAETAEGVRRHIVRRVLDHIVNNPKLIQKVAGTSKVWRPKVDYGYTFGSNRGLIKKLVDYLDDGYDHGTKLDFLEYIGKLKSKMENGKKLYSSSGSDKFLPSKNWRGHFASFFASAKQAGIIEYKKEGRNFIIKPGPNFEAFKSGELKSV
jgi:hypothetical protein